MVSEWMESDEFTKDDILSKIIEEFEVTEATAIKYIEEATNQIDTSLEPVENKPLKVAKGYESPLKERWEDPQFVDYDSKAYAFLEVENRAFNAESGKKTSRPQIVSYNRHDLVQFNGKKVEKMVGGKKVESWPIISQKRAQGLSVNAVLHIPEKFGIDVEVDEWPNK